MKKKISRVLALLLLLALLSGCAQALTGPRGEVLGLGAATGAEQTAFEQIVYIRPRLEELQQAVDQVKNGLDAGEGLREITDRLDRCYDLYYHFDTMRSLADIRACQDTTDAFYAREYAWCEENSSRAQQLMEEMYYACAASRLAGQLERQYFWEGFARDYADPGAAGALNGEAVALMQKESALLTEYRSLIATPTIEREGRETDYREHLAGLDDQELYAAARLDYYRKYNGRLAEIYIDLAAVRRELAAALGYDGYEQMQYEYYFQRDYSPRDAAGYLAEIKNAMVPFYRELLAGELYDRISYDYLSEERLHGVLGAAARRIGGQVQEAYEFMSDGGYYDIRLSPTKADMSFETYLTEQEAPFLFLDPTGDMEDILSYSHEFGHYVDAYVNYNAYETVDLSECFSQAMEYLMLSCYGEVLTAGEIENLTRMKLLDTLDLYVQQACFAEFESAVYAADPSALSAEFLNDLSLRLVKEYGLFDGESEDYYAMSWMDITHFFEYPFYVITYPVANDAAMQIYALEQSGEGKGMAVYQKMLTREGDGLLETLKGNGLESPFTPGRIEKVLAELRERLDGWEEAA